MERCRVCILPDSMPGVSLDETGKCNYCRNFEQLYSEDTDEKREALRLKLESVLEKYRGKGKYDFLVPMSGGKDGLFILYELAHKHKAKVLAFNIDTGFRSELAVRNMENAVKKLGVDFVVYKPNEQTLFKLFRTFLTESGEFCCVCNRLIKVASLEIAKKFDVPMIMMGAYGKYAAAYDHASPARYTNYYYYCNVLERANLDVGDYKDFAGDSPMMESIKKRAKKNPQLFDPLNYIDPGIDNLKKTIIEELEWQSPSEEIQHGDCLLNPLKDYLMNRKWGYSEITQAYSSLVRNGIMSRDEALRMAEEEEDEVRTPPPVLEMFLEKIGMTLDEFEESQKRHFSDIPNTVNNTYTKARKIYRRIRYGK